MSFFTVVFLLFSFLSFSLKNIRSGAPFTVSKLPEICFSFYLQHFLVCQLNLPVPSLTLCYQRPITLLSLLLFGFSNPNNSSLHLTFPPHFPKSLSHLPLPPNFPPHLLTRFFFIRTRNLNLSLGVLKHLALFRLKHS